MGAASSPDPLVAATSALAAGDLLLAYDRSTAGLAADAAHPRLRYLQVLALARMGETDRAFKLYDAALAANPTDLDTLTLGARLLKDRAWQASGEGAIDLIARAADAYEAIFRRTEDAFPAINAATLAMLAGQAERAQSLARAVLDTVGDAPSTDYYAAATVAEAKLLLGDEAGAEVAIEQALDLPGCNPGARSSTSTQLARIVGAGGCGARVVARLRPAPVVTFCGHMFGNSPESETALRRQIETAFDSLNSTIAYGALACGADILVAETVLARGGELHVVLPFRIEDFILTSVAPGGEGWIERFRHCLDRAAEVVIASETAALNDDRQYRYGSMMMMGFARLRARHLGTDAVQLALWDGLTPGGMAGTGADVELWRSHGGETRVIPLDRSEFARPAAAAVTTAVEAKREVRAMIFTDFAGFSRIDEALLPTFWELVLGRVARVVDRYTGDVCSRNTWGDALYVVTQTSTAAARLALDLQAELDPASMGVLGEGAGMRVSAHLGSVYEAIDPVTRKVTFFGREVNKTARIEPIALVGEVYVTRAFGAVLAMESPAEFELSYVGRVALAKQFGDEAMYRLTRAAR
ncbi:adenylate/guanylate cyclase domain-containing protein [Sphingomonas aliaeris]|uniref:Adenylate/guanylate cyclase domain-containing protein n=1 Tax=Sphingomonas aliaeris TaxID=2759526 RepID=A0A974NVI9_9SPHN|nr:adenylate/guanylate cyclase domain-containing protein [Sphingomonas aliaeris]QQV77687.1 adenylate/guanylate cyclase domain-containing protein [Sphingomonas aliaeris]